MINHLMLNSILSTAPLEYKGYKLKYFSQDVASLDYICVAQKDSFLEQRRDEHGKLELIRHESETFKFTVESSEFIIEDKEPVQLVWDRFKAEVDYYLNHKNNIKEEDFITKNFNVQKAYTRKYHCHCCGTELTTSEEGYTPQCKNCGALMHLL